MAGNVVRTPSGTFRRLFRRAAASAALALTLGLVGAGVAHATPGGGSSNANGNGVGNAYGLTKHLSAPELSVAAAPAALLLVGAAYAIRASRRRNAARADD